MIEFHSKNKDNAENAVGLLFMRTFNKWHTEIKQQLKELGITHPQFVILTTLGYLSQQESEVTQVMIAKLAGMDVMSVSQIVAILEKNDLIERKEHSKDTRAKSVSLTQKGKEKMNLALPIIEGIDLAFFGSLRERETEFINLLHELNQYDFR